MSWKPYHLIGNRCVTILVEQDQDTIPAEADLWAGTWPGLIRVVAVLEDVSASSIEDRDHADRYARATAFRHDPSLTMLRSADRLDSAKHRLGGVIRVQVWNQERWPVTVTLADAKLALRGGLEDF